MSTFAPTKFFILICNEMAQTEMVELWWSESLHCQLYFPQNNQFLHENINLKLNET